MSAADLQLAIAALSGGLVQWAARPLWAWLKLNSDHEISREEHISLLRKALDKAGIRFNGAVSVCDLLLIALELVEELPPAAERAKHQARQKLADVVATLESIGGVIDG